MSEADVIWAGVGVWYAFALWAVPKLERANGIRPPTPEDDAVPLFFAWLLSPVSVPVLVMMASDKVVEWAAGWVRPAVAWWLRVTGVDK